MFHIDLPSNATLGKPHPLRRVPCPGAPAVARAPWLRFGLQSGTSMLSSTFGEINGDIYWECHGDTSDTTNNQWEIFTILKWRYVSTICLAIFWGDIPLHRPYRGLIYGRYLQFRFLEWPLKQWGY